jgi:alanine racemase
MAPIGAKTWIEIDSRALSKNLATLRGLLRAGSVLCPVIKANAYGHGLETITRLLDIEGVQHFGVDSIDEARVVRRLSPNAEIFILGYTVPERLPDVVKGQFTQTVYDVATLEALAKLAAQEQTRARINVKIETGLHRQGINGRQLHELVRAFRANSHWIEFLGLSTHFCESENIDNQSFTFTQIERFVAAINDLAATDITPKFIHISCSAALMMHADSHFTMARAGLALYGLWPSDGVRQTMRLKGLELYPVLSWKTRLAQIKELQPGETVGYGRTFRADRPMRIAVLPVGYYDGFRRFLGNRGQVLVGGQRCPIVGGICMNMCMIDVSQAPQAKPGEIAILLGRDGMNQITAEDLATLYGTINYEVVTTIREQLPRVVC